MKNKSEWLDYIYQLNPKTIDLGLRRIQRCRIAERLQLTQFDCPVITIAGTNGKGSVVALLEAMLLAAGKKVAAYISPHLREFNERIRYNGQEISDHDLLASFKTIEQYREDTPLTFFEFTTLAALYYFKQQQPDVILLEVGLGGRHDAVNSVDCDVAVITSIDFDHQDYLGDTLEKIAYEKVGIARAFKPVICGDLDPPESIANYCEEIHAPLWLLHRDFTFQKDVNTWEWQGRALQYTALPYAKLKMENVATALAVIEYLWPNLPRSAVDSGIQTAGFAGRFEKTAEGIVYDVAHNPEATHWLAEQLQRDFPNKKITAIFSMLRDKDIAASILPLKSIIDEWCIIELDCPRAATIAEINTILDSQSVKKWYNFSTAISALQHVKQSHDPDKDVIVVFGSFYTVAAVKGALEWTSS